MTDLAHPEAAAGSAAIPPVLEIENLGVQFSSDLGPVQAVNGLSMSIRSGETLGVVGESGCGKSVTAMSVLRLIETLPGCRITGAIRYQGRNILDLGDREMRQIRGNAISMIFQEPMTSLNPVLSIGDQIMEAVQLHREVAGETARGRAIEMLERVRIPDPEKRLRQYPHELSGGMRQRVMIAMALVCRPSLLIADEPTTALDVTIQAQILTLLRDLQSDMGTAVMLITHDMGVIAENAERVVVMYAGRKIEEAPVDVLFANPRHPYTRGLLGSIPRVQVGVDDRDRVRLQEIPGTVPSLNQLPPGCAYAERCAFADSTCRTAFPPTESYGPDHTAACWHARDPQANTR